jgi:hypothetical protein
VTSLEHETQWKCEYFKLMRALNIAQTNKFSYLKFKPTFFPGCPVSFEFQNYTIITSQCKGPDYPATQCCAALVEFACPFSVEINDSTNDCASTMFSYINTYGQYPPGLFASECKGDKNGLPCPATNSTSQTDKSGVVAANNGVLSRAWSLLLGVIGFAVLFL